MAAPFRYRRLGYVLMNVSDIERSSSFVQHVFGLDLVKEDAGGRRYFRGSAHHHDVIMTQASEPALVRTAWELETMADLDAAFAYFEAEGMASSWIGEDECRELEIERGFRTIDPIMGLMWEYFVDMTVIPSPRRNMLTSFQGGMHVGISPENGAAVNDFLTDKMGFLMSDYFQGRAITLLRAFPNPNHHSIALIGTGKGATRMHHIAFMVNEIDDIGRLFNRTKKLGVDIQFGIGRHPTSGSIHIYIYDHDNFVWEYTLGMEQFPEHGARAARRMSLAPEDFDLWGAVPDTTRREALPRVLAWSPESLANSATQPAA